MELIFTVHAGGVLTRFKIKKPRHVAIAGFGFFKLSSWHKASWESEVLNQCQSGQAAVFGVGSGH